MVDPNLFRVDWEQLAEVLGLIIVLSFFVERSLAIVLENKHVAKIIEGRGIKEVPAVILSLFICLYFEFDALAIVLHHDKNEAFGYIVTALIISGGSKASIKLFHDVMGAKPKHLKDKVNDSNA